MPITTTNCVIANPTVKLTLQEAAIIPGFYPHSTRELGGTSSGDVTYYHCDEGFHLENGSETAVSTCLPESIWGVPDPCVRKLTGLKRSLVQA